VFCSETDELDHDFTSSYTGDAEIVLAGRSAGTRLTFGTGVVAYEPEQAEATAGGGSAVIAPAVALPESNGMVAMGVDQPSNSVPNSYGILLKDTENWNGYHRTPR
jgi:hypothetical protein